MYATFFITVAVLSYSATLSNLNACNFLKVKYNIIFNPFFWNAQLESDPKHTRHARLSLMVNELIAIKIYEIAESGDTARQSMRIRDTQP